ncbi:MAG: LysR family transcriptional regulator [Solirubrobacterales bacterium]|nr:LysR family transcriptional regulator [Solirubrobacterales bacterium]
MELRQLRYFVAVAEELHFSRAAARLSLAQSALSSQIRQLERELGGQLLIRSTRRVELTPAGESLLADGREILAAADDAVHRARALARGESGRLTIGSLGPAPGEILAPLLARLASRHPDVRVEVRAFDFTDIVDGVLDRNAADIAFVYLPLDEPMLHVTPLISEPRVVVLPRRHRLAKRKRLAPHDLAEEMFITEPPSVPQAWRDYWLLLDELGRRPPISPHIGDKLDDWLRLIARGEGIDTAPAIISRYYPWPELAYVQLVDAAPSVIALARRRDAEHPLVGEVEQITLDIVSRANLAEGQQVVSTAGDH